jgi:chromosome partitioning protein
MYSMVKVYSIVIRKGGSGKTTTAVNFAQALRERGRRVLLVDLDPGADATKHVGLKPRELHQSINTLFTKIGVDPRDIVQMTKSGLAILPATRELEATDRSMKATQVGLLKPIVETLSQDYDYIIIDTKPAESYLTFNALIASTHVLIPMQTEYFAMDGLVDTLQDISDVKRGLNPHLTLVGILPTQVRAKTNLAKTVLEEVGQEYRQLILPVSIRHSVKLGEAAYAGMPGLLYAPESEAARDYVRLAEVIDRAEA